MHLLDSDTRLTAVADGAYTAQITSNWSINGSPNGGYLMALMAQSIRKESRTCRPLILTLSYLARCVFDDAEIQVEKISASKNFERWEARLIQAGEIKVLALGTFTNIPLEVNQSIHESGPPQLPPLAECIEIPVFDKYTLYNQMDVRLSPRSCGWFTDQLSEPSEIRGWIKFKERRELDALAVLLMADAFPPPVMVSKGRVAWIPTLELSVCLRNPPRSDWLKGIFRTRHITSGILEEDGELWDQEGTLVAVSRQIAQFRKRAK